MNLEKIKSTETERRLISSCIIGGPSTVSYVVAQGVTSETFADHDMKKIFLAVSAVASRDRVTDLASIMRELGGFASQYGVARLSEIDGLETSSIRAKQLAEDVIGLHRQRKLVSSLSSALELANASTASWSDLSEAVDPFLRAATEAGTDLRHRTLADASAQAVCWRLEPDSRPKVSTPWPAWDRVAKEPRGGELIVIAGRPGTGKTTIAGNIADEIACSGRTVAFFSLEMGTEELVDRFAVRRAGKSGTGDDRKANEAVAAKIRDIGKMKNLHIYESDTASSTAQIEANCRLLASSPTGLAAVFIDYLQLVTPPADARKENRELQVAGMTRRFKLLARAIKAPVFLLAQLNREMEKEDRRPRLSDLRESGAIEQDADRVWFLFKPKVATNAFPEAEDAPEIDVMLYQAKCRNGTAGIQTLLRFNRPCLDFRKY